MVPKTQFATTGNDRIAYQVIGDGPLDLVLTSVWMTHIDGRWDEPNMSRTLRRLASFSRLIMFDRRGAGASDPLPGDAPPTFEDIADDIRAVMAAAGSRQAAIIGIADGGLAAVLFGAAFPALTTALVLVNATARLTWAHDYPCGLDEALLEQLLTAIGRDWGTGVLARLGSPSLASDERFVEWQARYERMSGSPRRAEATARHLWHMDIRHVLPAVRVPTLVLHGKAVTIPPLAQGRYVADHIPDARWVELEGADVSLLVNSDPAIDETEEFLTGARHRADPDRVLATVLFTDIVGSTKHAAELGDRAWRELMDAHDTALARQIETFQGKLIKHTGDGLVATFDGPARALRCAAAVVQDVRRLGIEIRTGLHTGEIELIEHDIQGIAVHIAARVMEQADAGDVLVSHTVKDLVTGSGIAFTERGVRELKGVPGDWKIFAAAPPVS